MKKLSLIVSGLVCASSLFANSSMDIGFIKAKVGDGGSNSGLSIDAKSFMHPKGFKNLSLGISIGSNYFKLDDTKSLSDDAGYSVDLDLLVGYDYKKTTFYLGGGYSLGQFGSATFDGSNYQVGAEYNFSKNYGIGVKYKHNKLDLTGGSSNLDLDITSLYIKYHN